MGIPMGIGTGLFKLLHKYPFILTIKFACRIIRKRWLLMLYFLGGWKKPLLIHKPRCVCKTLSQSENIGVTFNPYQCFNLFTHNHCILNEDLMYSLMKFTAEKIDPTPPRRELIFDTPEFHLPGMDTS